MSRKVSVCNVERVERRQQWRDRRSGKDRRNKQRLQLQVSDARSGLPRRIGDYSGSLTEGIVWWLPEKHP